ncbi:unnamed protein product [Orchesella dallaii]|uniref:Protein kinase domain-containing protein n=1 Tax=Orchesella dallaii TaxID=48710 RepID=A0ABP1PX25_9HEXA
MSTPGSSTPQALLSQPVTKRPRGRPKGSKSVTSKRKTGNGKRKHVEPPVPQPAETVIDAAVAPPAKIAKSTIITVGDYYLGPELEKTPVKCIRQYLARKPGCDNFYVVKMLTLKDKDSKEPDTRDYLQGKNLLLTEHTILSLLQGEEGVVQGHGLFRATMDETTTNEDGPKLTKPVTKICLAVDCFVNHDFSPKYREITNLHDLMVKEQIMVESKAIRIFYDVVKIVERLHKLNIVHRDIKLGTMIMNKATGEMKLANFCLGVHLTSDNDSLCDKQGSPAYIAPDVLVGKPYIGKPCDMWGLGVSLYIMVYGRFPFREESIPELYRKIISGDFVIPVGTKVSDKTVDLIKSLLDLNPLKRPNASQVVKIVEEIILTENSLMRDSDLQTVPNIYITMEEYEERIAANKRAASEAAMLDFEAFVAKTIGDIRSPGENASPTNVDNTIADFPNLPGNSDLEKIQRQLALSRLYENSGLPKPPGVLFPWFF